MIDQPRGFNKALQNVGEEADISERLRALVQTLSAYIEHYHGGGVEMVGFQENVLKVQLSGACEGCDLAPVTLHGWVEGTIHQFFPEVQVVAAE